jgi:hypothetical protein
MVIPNFVKERQTEFGNLIESVFTFSSKKSHNHIKRRLKKGSDLLDRLDKLSHTHNHYIGVHPNRFTIGKSPEHLERLLADKKSLVDAGAHQCSLFANSLSTHVSDPHGNLIAPKDRLANCGFMIHTIEIDPPSNEEVMPFLDQQVSWCFGGGHELDCLMGQFYKTLSHYSDFRGLEVVWSGSKSLHIHMAFDTRHLDADKFGMRKDRLPEPEFWNLDDRYLRKGYSDAWSDLKELFISHFGHIEGIDPILRFADQYRRLPFGIRIAEPDHPLGIPEGTEILQLPLWSKFRNNGAGGKCWLHTPSRFMAADKQSVSYTDRAQIKDRYVPAELSEKFITELATLCEKLWGNPEHHPRPHSLSIVDGDAVIHFFNNAADQKPSSVMRGSFNTLHIASKQSIDPPTPLPMSANEMYHHFLDIGSLFQFKEEKKQSILERKFHEEATSEEDIRVALEKLCEVGAMNVCRAAILSNEGAGKTTALLKLIEVRVDADLGPIIVSCDSYDQARNKCREFNSSYAGGFLKGTLLKSFSKMYEDCFQNQQRIDQVRAAEMGYSSVIQAVYNTEPETVKVLEDAKKRMWANATGVVPVFFTVHHVVKLWHAEGGTRFWMHPRYTEYLQDREAHRSQIRNETEPQWIIFDEVNSDHLITVTPERDVNFARALTKRNKGWHRLSLKEQMDAFNAMNRNPDIAFKYIQQVIHQHYKDDEHLVEVDPDIEPFGINNKEDSYYVRCKGSRYYVKPDDWWAKLGPNTNITMLTTEHRIFSLLKWIKEDAKRNGADRTHFFHTLDLDKKDLFPLEKVSVDLVLNKHARKVDIDDLVDELFANDPNVKIITDMCDRNETLVTTHMTAKGSNAFKGDDVTAIFTYLSEPMYERLVIENILTGRNDMVKQYYVDLVNQSLGRTLGFRHTPNTTTTLILTPKLWKEIGTTLINNCRYHFVKK